MLNNAHQTFYTFLALGLAILIWSSSVSLSSYLAKEPQRTLEAKHQHLQAGDHAAGSAGSDVSHDHGEMEEGIKESAVRDIAALREALSKNSESIEAQVALANALFEYGLSLPNGTYLKEAVGEFHQILENDPANKSALLGMATLSLHVGVADKAVDYYEKLLKLDGLDSAIKANYALSLARADKVDKAIEVLDEVLKVEPKLVIALVTKGLVLSESGHPDNARPLIERALDLEKNPLVQKKISEMLERLDTPMSAPRGEGTSVEAKLSDLIAGQEVLSNKVRNVEVLEGIGTLTVIDFPVQQMPDFAKQALLVRLADWRKDLSLGAIRLIDGDSKAILIESKD